ncbi:MFS transporter [Paractinoplanes deccanensis]|uniref:MFS transporter n=1 Tax=Paractinoplanes deccanensis TaxID=113561 RepID=A0ABQ3XY59_9ACTN|nr:MFS transporter [Actinoplanes deccanensis]GID72679.1 MFS transporter [Actinoplanes deccanensis]
MSRTPHPALVLAAACVCQALVVLDVTLVNVALPSVAADLGFTPAGLSWVVNAYTLALGGLLLLGGRFADLVGHRAAMFSGLGLFGAASVLGGLAQSPGELIAARAAQGVAGAVLAPLSLTVIMVTFPEGTARSRAIGVWSMVAAGGSALGVLLGGALTQGLSWRWVLLINVPIALAALLLAAFSVRGTRTSPAGRLDVAGAVLVTAAVTALVHGTIQAAERGWGSAAALSSFAVALLAGAAFAGWELRVAPAPLVRFGVLRSRPVWVANVIVLFLGGTTVAGFYFASLYLQDVLHYTPLRAGAAFLPFCLGTVVGAMSSGPLTGRLGARAVMTGGLVLGAAGMVLFSRADADSTFLDGFLLPSVLASIGIGWCMVANTTLATTGAAPGEAGLVSGLLNAGRQIGGSLSLAVLTTVALAAAEHSGATSLAGARAAGYSRAFLVTAGFVLVAALVAAAATPSVTSSVRKAKQVALRQ